MHVTLLLVSDISMCFVYFVCILAQHVTSISWTVLPETV